MPFTAGLTKAISVGLSPRWVQYSGVSAAACKLAEVLADIVTMNTRGDQRPTLDREFLAYSANFRRADKISSHLDELQKIGFLTIFDGGKDESGKRQQRRRANGQPVPDHFEISLEPPLGYKGPCNLTDVYGQFIVDRDAAYRAAEAAGKKPRTGRQAIPRTEVGSFEKPEVGAVTGFRGQGGAAVTGMGGQLKFPQVGAVTGFRGQDGAAVTGMGGQLKFPQVEAVTGFRGHLQIDRSSISEGDEIEDRSMPVPGGTAQPPATGMDERQLAAVREAVRSFPINAWYAKRGQARKMSRQDADILQAAVCDAMQRADLTLEHVREIGQAAVTDAKKTPVAYVAAAFGAKLPIWLARVSPEPGAANPLPLLDGASESSKAAKTPANASSVVTSRLEPVVDSGPCPGCGAEPGMPRMYRTVEVEDGRVAFCKVCCPPAPAR